MNAVLPKSSTPRMTLEQFLAWEDRQELRHEFDGFQPVAMTGVSAAHAIIQMNVGNALGLRLRGRPCRPFGSDLKIRVAGRIRYPDVFVACLPITPDTKVITEPVVVFEVLSESTADIDVMVKNAEYRATPSIKRYVILRQDAASAVVFSRKGEDWVTEFVFGADATLHLPELDLAIPLAEIYADTGLLNQPQEPLSEEKRIDEERTQ